MAIGYIQNNGNGGSGVSSPQTLPLTVSTSCTLLLIARAGSRAITSASIDGQAFTAIDNTTFGASMELWGIINPPTGSQTITTNWVGGADTYDLDAIQYSGVLNTTTISAATPQKTSTSGTGTLNTTVTTTKDNSWLFAVLASLTNSGTVSAGTNTTKRVGNGTNSLIEGTFDSNAPQTPPGSFSLQVTNAQPGSNMLMISMAPLVSATFSVSDSIASTEHVSSTRGAIFSLLNTITLTEAVNVMRGAVFSVANNITTSEVFSLVFKWTRQIKSSSIFTNLPKD